VAQFTLKRQVHVRLSLVKWIAGLVFSAECGYRGIYRAISGGAPGDTSGERVAHPTDEGHGNSLLKNEQHVFTPPESAENIEEKLLKGLEKVSNSVFRRGVKR
jgi:hypothetical protein